MNIDDYQVQSAKTAVYPRLGHGVVYPALGLAGEAGEVAEKVKKLIRDDNLKLSDEKKSELKKELGDVLWYVAQLATELDLSLNDIAYTNLEKLASRADRGKLKGSGDNR